MKDSDEFIYGIDMKKVLQSKETDRKVNCIFNILKRIDVRVSKQAYKEDKELQGFFKKVPAVKKISKRKIN